MSLIDYIQQLGGSATLSCPVVAEIAARAECTPATLYMIAHGHKTSGPLLARRIETATRGEVSRADLRPDVFGNPFH